MDRVRTGIEGLDQLLYGGFLRGDAVLVAGAPGTGKTSLGMQFLFNGITKYNEPGLFITFEEFPDRIYRDADNFGWDFRRLEDEGKLRVLFTSPEVLQRDILQERGLVREMISELGARRVVVDSISNIHSVTENPLAFREAVYGLVNALKAESLTALLTRELVEEEEAGSGPEEFVADALIRLTRTYVAAHRMRYLEVLKSRGTPHVQIPCLYFLGEGGLRIIPPFQQPFYRFEEAVATGIPQLDDLLGGGIPYGAFYLMEIDVDLHQDIFDAGFASEALEAGDRYVRIAAPSDARSRWRALLKAAGLQARLEAALASGQAVFLGSRREQGKEAQSLADYISEQLAPLCQEEGEVGVRFQVDISRLFALLSREEANCCFAKLTGRCRGSRSVVLGSVSPQGFPPELLDKLRAQADGIVRVWSERSYTFLQVVKTVNSARTPVYLVLQTPRPPFIEIIEQ